jgi:hypothetical protein
VRRETLERWRPDKPVPRCGSPVYLATRNAVRSASLPLWCLSATDRGHTGTLGAVRELKRTANLYRQMCRSGLRPWCWEFVASRAERRYSTPEVFEVRRCCPAMRRMCRGIVAQRRIRRETERRRRCPVKICVVCRS